MGLESNVVGINDAARDMEASRTENRGLRRFLLRPALYSTAAPVTNWIGIEDDEQPWKQVSVRSSRRPGCSGKTFLSGNQAPSRQSRKTA